jgi:hypothetical protein
LKVSCWKSDHIVKVLSIKKLSAPPPYPRITCVAYKYDGFNTDFMRTTDGVEIDDIKKFIKGLNQSQ